MVSSKTNGGLVVLLHIYIPLLFLLLPLFFNSCFSHFLQISVAVKMEPSDVPLTSQETDILHSFLD
ncbi:hypothetical protein L208DRAFT_891454 [Tricholoma matsutake]|nr:hypothetical protein L208DRAFT_891454 [Tricholoma matsutake 945]